MAKSQYNEIINADDIYAGATGEVKSKQDILNFLNGWSTWLASIITTVKGFFDDLMASLKKDTAE